jgi:hypothetical protein
MASKEKQNVSRVAGPVRIVIPAKVAYDIGAIHKVVDNIVNELGCSTCFSGADCHIEIVKNWLVDPENLKVVPAVVIGPPGSTGGSGPDHWKD